jgi:hypothetical protein
VARRLLFCAGRAAEAIGIYPNTIFGYLANGLRSPDGAERGPCGADRLRSRAVTASRPSGAIVPMENTVLGGVQLTMPATLELFFRCELEPG